MARDHPRSSDLSFDTRHKHARQLVVDGHWQASQNAFTDLQEAAETCPQQASLLSDLGVLDAVHGDLLAAETRFQESLRRDSGCNAARANLQVLRQATGHLEGGYARDRSEQQPDGPIERRTRIAFLSLLFNWPSTGGGTIHTRECAEFLQRDGYEVQHIYACFPEWGVGRVTEPLKVPTQRLTFDASSWNPETIRRQFREALDEFAPDFVIVTDSWNTKPLLAEAAEGYRYFLRIAAMECVCPLNNVRLLVDDTGVVRQCDRNQLADAASCRQCVAANRRLSGGLHHAERQLAEFDDPGYGARLRNAFADAEAVLVVNPQIAELVRPFASRVEVVPSGFDPDRFPDRLTCRTDRQAGLKRIVFAGLIDEFMKGFHVLQAAGECLWSRRQDFEILATADPVGRRNEFTRLIGWQSQAQLPQCLSAADQVVFPTIAQEALGRSAVEAMGCGRPVVASRIGGLQYVVDDEATGLLVEPGDADALAAAIERLLDDGPLCERMGFAARHKFQQQYTWDAIIRGCYRPLLGDPTTGRVRHQRNQSMSKEC